MWVSDFERTLDGLVGDGLSIIKEFVGWESSGPTYSFNDLRNALCREAKLCFNADHIYLFGLAYTGRDSKKSGPLERLNSKVLTSKDIQQTWTLYLNSMQILKHSISRSP